MATTTKDRLREAWREDRGQSFVIVAVMLTVLLGFMGIVIDIGWYEVNLIRVQRAADAVFRRLRRRGFGRGDQNPALAAG